MKVDTIFTASEIATPENKLLKGKEMQNIVVIKDGAVAVDNGKIIDFGKENEIRSKYTGEIISFEGKTMLPGFVDSHTHLVFSGTRENELIMKLKGKKYLEILKEGGGIQYTVERTRAASKSKLKKEAEKRLNNMLKNGTTTVEAKSGYGLNRKDEIKSLEILKEMKHDVDIIPTFLVHAIPKESNEKDYIDLCIDMLDEIKERDLAEFVDIFCEKDVFSVRESERFFEAAKKKGFKLRIHADEIEDTGGAELAAKLDAKSADHLLKASDKGLKMMTEKNIVATLLPGTPFSLFTDFPNARKMIDLNLPIALATDLNPNCYTESLQFIFSLAVFKMKMLPEECISSIKNGAYSLDRNIGCIDRGVNADLVVMDIPNHRHIGYHFGVNLVSTVIKNGAIVWESI
ncbi:MAG: imidazolonepropionase [Methanomicrobia archaeon]|nr:imidazolonepropionase [Methanomicrobia archaeon]RLF95088.1 MAG: imidazolonepropionase [Thermococci archaeon]